MSTLWLSLKMLGNCSGNDKKKKKSYQLIWGLIYNNEIIEKNQIQENQKSPKDPN